MCDSKFYRNPYHELLPFSEDASLDSLLLCLTHANLTGEGE